MIGPCTSARLSRAGHQDRYTHTHTHTHAQRHPHAYSLLSPTLRSTSTSVIAPVCLLSSGSYTRTNSCTHTQLHTHTATHTHTRAHVQGPYSQPCNAHTRTHTCMRHDTSAILRSTYSALLCPALRQLHTHKQPCVPPAVKVSQVGSGGHWCVCGCGCVCVYTGSVLRLRRWCTGLPVRTEGCVGQGTNLARSGYTNQGTNTHSHTHTHTHALSDDLCSLTERRKKTVHSVKGMQQGYQCGEGGSLCVCMCVCACVCQCHAG